jgi:chromosome segregation ATPase
MSDDETELNDEIDSLANEIETLTAALATEAAKREQAEGRIVQLEAALATERAARERAEAQVAALMRVTEDQIRDAIKAQDAENANLPAASGAKGGENDQR